MTDQPLNDLAPPDWQRHEWLGDLVDDAEPAARFAGMACTVFGVTPDGADAEGRTMPVGLHHIPTGRLVAEGPHGAACMGAADDLILQHGYMFDRWPLDVEALTSCLDSVVATLMAFGCRPMLDE